MCIMHCRKYHLHNYNKNCDPHICCRAETVTCICAAETSNYITATETAPYIIVTARSTNIPVTESNTWKNLPKCNRRCHLHNCHRYIDQLHSYSRNCNLQKWLQKLSLAEMVPVWDSFIYNKEIKQIGKH